MELGRSGAIVYAIGRRGAELEAIKKECGDECAFHAVPLDGSDFNAVDSFIEKTGHIDLLFINHAVFLNNDWVNGGNKLGTK